MFLWIFHGTHINWWAYYFCDWSFSIDCCHSRGGESISHAKPQIRCRKIRFGPQSDSHDTPHHHLLFVEGRKTIVSWIYKITNITVVQLNVRMLLYCYTTIEFSNVTEYSHENQKSCPKRDHISWSIVLS